VPSLRKCLGALSSNDRRAIGWNLKFWPVMVSSTLPFAAKVSFLCSGYLEASLLLVGIDINDADSALLHGKWGPSRCEHRSKPPERTWACLSIITAP